MLRSELTLSNRRLFVGAVLLSVAPLWFGWYPPMVDVPQHAAQVAALKELLAGDSSVASYFRINWFTPYLVGYLLLYALAAVLPLAVAMKIVVSISIISVPLLTGLLLREVGADTRWRWLAIPCSYSFSFYWGFVSFMVAVPIALLLLAYVIRFDRNPTIRSGALVGGLALFLFFCHVIALGLIGVAAVSYIAGRHYDDAKAAAIRLIPLAAPLPVIGLWLAFIYETGAKVHGAGVFFGPLQVRFALLLTEPAGLDRLTAFGAVTTAAIVLLPPLAGARFTRNPARWLLFIVGLLVWDAPDKQASRLEPVGMVLIFAWIVLNSARFASFARESQTFDAILANMEPGYRAAMLIVEPWTSTGSAMAGPGTGIS